MQKWKTNNNATNRRKHVIVFAHAWMTTWAKRRKNTNQTSQFKNPTNRTF